LVEGREICTLGMHRNKKERERKNDGQRGRFDKGERERCTLGCNPIERGKKKVTAKEGGRSSKRESMCTPRCVTTEETKSFNAKEKEREPQC